MVTCPCVLDESNPSICRAQRKGINMYIARKKIQKGMGVEPSEFGDTIEKVSVSRVPHIAGFVPFMSTFYIYNYSLVCFVEV